MAWSSVSKQFVTLIFDSDKSLKNVKVKLKSQSQIRRQQFITFPREKDHKSVWCICTWIKCQTWKINNLATRSKLTSKAWKTLRRNKILFFDFSLLSDPAWIGIFLCLLCDRHRCHLPFSMLLVCRLAVLRSTSNRSPTRWPHSLLSCTQRLEPVDTQKSGQLD